MEKIACGNLSAIKRSIFFSEKSILVKQSMGFLNVVYHLKPQLSLGFSPISIVAA